MNFSDLLYAGLYLCYTGLFLYIIHRSHYFESTGLSRRRRMFFFLLKASAGVALTLVYTYYYTDRSKQDIYRYFDDSLIISSVLWKSPSAWLQIMTGYGLYEPEVFRHLLDTQHFTHRFDDSITSNMLIIRLLSLMNFFSMGNIYINTLFFNMLSFTGLTLLYRTFITYTCVESRWWMFPLFLLPSVLFWGSGLLKESLLFFAIPVYLHFLLNQNRERQDVHLLWVSLALAVIVLTKFHIAVLLLWCSLLLPVNLFRSNSRFETERRLVLFLLAGGAALYFFGADICEMVMNKRNEFIVLGWEEQSGSTVASDLATGGCSDMFRLLPGSMLTALLRPYLWEGNWLYRVFALESLVFILALIYRLRRFHITNRYNNRLAMFCFVFAFLNYMVIGMTAPILGAVVHYRVIAMIFLWLGVLLMTGEKESSFTENAYK